jgi:DNA helicase II / ATP-dependent DNA helicase PcrA
LSRLGREYLEAEGGSGTVDGFLVFLQAALRGDDAATPAEDAVELLTFHRAKGLEFDTVFVTGLERGLVPISHAKTQDALDEEQRLLYVALSRAERALHLSWARQRTVGMRSVSRKPSPWLARVERVIAGNPPDEPSVDASAAIADARARISDRANGDRGKNAVTVAEADAPLYAALVEWRRKLSKAAATPAYVVFHDATLAAIAATRPRTATELLAVAGVGPVKVERYGADVLALVVEHPAAVTA